MITVRISFKKMNEASYISLLDMQRVMQRVLKRSGLPVWHTLGFNPHIYMTLPARSRWDRRASASAWMSRPRPKTPILPSGRRR